MSRYIDADEFLRFEIERNGCIPLIDGGGYNLDRLDDEINNFPTAEVQQIKHGRWIDDTKNLERVCSNCGREVVYQIIDGRWEYENYCPHCGAKMDGKED